MSKSLSTESPTLPKVSQTVTQLPAPSVVTWGEKSKPKSKVASVSSKAGAVHVAPLSVDVATKMSGSVPAVPPRVSSDCHTATQLPAPSAATWGETSKPASKAAFVLSTVGVVHVNPLFIDVATKMSSSEPRVPSKVSSECHTASQLPAPSVVT